MANGYDSSKPYSVGSLLKFLVGASKASASTSVEDTSLNDGASLTLNIDCEDAEKITYVAESDEDFQINVTHFESTGQSGNSITQDASSGTVSGGSVDGQVIQSAGLSARVTLTDQSTDGGNSATATLLIKAI